MPEHIKNYRMKTLLFTVLMSIISGNLFSQYYYNDILTTAENMRKRELFKQQQVKGIRFMSFDGTGQPIDGFSSEQTVSNNFTEIGTLTTTNLTGATRSTSWFNAGGQLIKTLDTSDGNSTTVNYFYDAANRITSLVSVSISPGAYTNKEQHIWTYKGDRPSGMLKIRNERDTTYISFEADEQGNVAEEKSRRNGQAMPTVYYYYNDKHQLTDIVRYNARAKRLLPDYIFEYDAQGRPATMLVTTEGSNEYQKWYYTYNEKGLKVKDECYSRNRTLIGRVEYQYR